MKIFLFFYLLINIVFANDINLEQKYFIDKNNNLSLQEIIKNKKKFISIKKSNLGVIKKNIWIYMNINNTSKKVINRRIHAKRAGIDFIDVSILKNNKLTKFYKLGDMRKYKNRDNIFRVSYFDVSLKPFEKLDIYIKHKTYGSMDIRWEIAKKESFEKYYNKQALIYSFLIGIFCISIFLSFLLFIHLKNIFYLIYSLFTLFITIFQLSFAGFFYEFTMPIYFINLSNYSIPTIGGVLLGLFPLYFFNLRKDEFPYLIGMLKISILISFVFAIIFLFYPLSPSFLYNIKYSNLSGLLSIIVLTILAIRIYLAKKERSFFYLISNLIFVVFMGIFILGLLGITQYSDFYYYTLPIGTIGQDLFLGFALIHSAFLIKKGSDKKTQLLNEYSKLSFIGQTMINISHQWKTPINTIYNSINHIETARDFKDNNFNLILDKNLKDIKDTTIYLKDTALSQLDFYKSKKEKEKINIYEELEFMIKLIENDFKKKSINIDLNFDKNISLLIQKNYFLNVMMILFENSYKIFEQRNIKTPQIDIEILEKNSSIILIFQDNAQGAKDDVLKIFDKTYSLNDSTGLGLYLAKEIVVYKLQGEITAENKNDGICFTLKLLVDN